MGNVIISPNIKKESVRIDPSGNIIDPRTKQIIKALEPEFIPPSIQTSVQTPEIPTKIGLKIDDMISKKIEEIINRKIEEALNNL